MAKRIDYAEGLRPLEFEHTVIEPDPAYKTLRMRARAAILGGKLEWRHHGIGVLQAYVDEGTPVEHRLHIWSKSLIKNGIDQSGDVHDHRFDMVSHVLFGELLHVEVDFRPSDLGAWTMMELVHARAAGAENNFHAPMRPTGIRYMRTGWLGSIHATQLYRFPARQFHQTVPITFAITWVEKHNQRDEPARIAHPIDIPAVPAFGHTPDRQQIEYLVALAAEVLKD